MKQMIQIATIGLMLILAQNMFAQEFKQDKGATKVITLDQVAGQIILSEHNGSQVMIKANGFQKKELPEKAKGLKQINTNGVDNTGIGLSMTQKGDALEFVSVGAPDNPVVYHFQVPKGMAVKIDNSKMINSFGFLRSLESYPSVALKEVDDEAEVEDADIFSIDGDKYFFEEVEKPKNGKKSRKMAVGIIAKNFSGELEIKTMNDGISLNNVTGPLTVNTMNGTINIEFTSVNQSAPITVTSYNGEIDVTMPADTKANLKLSSMNGDIYTNFDIKFENAKKDNGLRYIGGGSNINGTINGGGVEVMLKSLSDNIYLRKK